MNSYYRRTPPIELTPNELAEVTTVHCICPCRAEQKGSMAELRRQGWAFDVGEYGEDLCPTCSPYNTQKVWRACPVCKGSDADNHYDATNHICHTYEQAWADREAA
jgi:hypothetical protein